MTLADKWRQLERALSEGPTEPDHKIVHQIGNDWESSLLSLGKSFVFQAARVWAGSASGLPYLYYTLTQPKRYWPSLPPDQAEALALAIRLAAEAGVMPFPTLSELPPVEEEQAVNVAIQKLALWARMDMVVAAGRALTQILQKNVPAILRVHQERLPKEKAYAYLKLLFKYDIKNHAKWFNDPTLLSRMLLLTGL